jgi:magnesium chelatase family protein
MLGKARTCAIIGLDGALVEVEVDISQGLPAFMIVGLPDTAVQEAKERVRTAIKNCGCVFPQRRITVNLAPADLRKEGPAYDLPIAVGILLASEQIPAGAEDCLFLGELSLDGSVRHTNGMLPMVAVARDAGLASVFVPATDALEASLIPDVTVFPVDHLAQLVMHLRGEQRIAPFDAPDDPFAGSEPLGYPVNLADVRGQEHVKRALEVAASGGHNILMSGPPGSGKTLLARATPSILPPMASQEALEVTQIYSVSGLLGANGQGPLVRQRPFRAPHHTTSHAGLVGGGRWPRPGEISLAHRGVLFLDELPEFGQNALEVLRQPLEDKLVTISRAQGTVTFPANFMLIAAMNPCPCGYYSDPTHECTCSPATIARYQKRLSGPLLDRVDIHVEVPRVDYEKLAGQGEPERSEVVRQRVIAARVRQAQRFAGTTLTCNADMGPADIRRHCEMEPAAQSLLKAAAQQLQLSARAYHRTLKLARTIADLADASIIGPTHLAEAIQYRPRIQI